MGQDSLSNVHVNGGVEGLAGERPILTSASRTGGSGLSWSFLPGNGSGPQSRGRAVLTGPAGQMEGIRLEAWATFATISGGAAAALTGLHFVAVSIRITSVAQSQELRNRAAQTLSLFGTVLIISVLLAIPGQAYRTLDAELVVLAVIAGAGLYALGGRAKGGRSDQAAAPVLDAVSPNTITSVLLLAAG
jgi:hypothetical protein